MGTVFTCDIGGESILLDLDEATDPDGARNHELWRAKTYGTKEPDTLAWIDTFFGEGDVVYDIGANIGQYSLYAAKKLGGRAEVLAFEPEALNYAKLNRNIVLNDLVGAVIPYALAVAGRTAFGPFFVKSFAPGAALHAWGQPITQSEVPFPSENQQGVLAVSLDDLTGRFSLPFPSHIKVDVDGIENQVVGGATQTLQDPRLKTVLIEIFIHGDVASQIKDAFLGSGFVLHNADDIGDDSGVVHNFIFTRA